MNRRLTAFFFNPFLLSALLGVAALWLLLVNRGSGRPQAGAGEIVVYTNPGATTPVLPLCYIAREGKIPGVDFRFRHWNSPVTLQSLLLAGDGVLWVGHTESFIRAQRHGAPVRLLAVTGWRKWQIVSRLPGKRFPEDFCPDGRLDFAPPGSSGKVLVEKLLQRQGLKVEFAPVELQALMLRLVEGRSDTAMLPEPFATTVLARLPEMRIVSSAEKIYDEITGNGEAVPWAGIAINTEWEAANPELAAALEKEIVASAHQLSQMDAATAMSYWQGDGAVSRESLVRSLERDVIRAVPAAACENIIKEYLELIDAREE